MLYTEYLDNKRDYQEEGAKFLLERKHCCLYYKPGKGKTYPCIDAIRDIDASMNGMAETLIISTADAIKNMWKAEIVPQNILPTHTTFYTTTKAVTETDRRWIMSRHWDIIVVDECHKVKAHNTKISKLIYLITKNTEYVFGLSGTPRGNSDLDVYCQFHNLNIGNWGHVTYTHFVNEYCLVDTMMIRMRCIQKVVGLKKSFLPSWEREVAWYTRREDYDDNDKMPELIVRPNIIRYIPTKMYREAVQGIIQLNDYATTLNKLTAIAKAHQIANGFMYLNNNDKTVVFDENDRRFEKVKELDSMIRTDPDIHSCKKIVVIYKFRYDLTVLKEQLKAYLYTEDVNAFKTDDSRILFLQCSHSESINLQVADAMIFYTMDYSYINYEQMVHRAWRMGRDKPVFVVPMIFEHTVESTIWKTVTKKGKLADLFYAIKGGDETWT